MRRIFLFSLILFCVACSPSSDKLKPYVPAVADEFKDLVSGEYIFNAKVDVLFVIDNSGSMDSHQQNLASNIQYFVDKMTQLSFLDFHIGVVTSDRFDNGRLKGNTRFVTNTTTNLKQVLYKNLLVGTSGDGYETFFDPVYEALTEPNLSGHNSGFYRSDAFLAIMFVTDAEDQSYTMDPDTLYNFLLDLKNKDATKVLAYGAIIPSNVNNCPRDDWETPRRIEEFYRLAKGISFSLCANDFGTKLGEFGDDLTKRVGKMIRLTRRPIPSTIIVKYGTQIIPNDLKKGWTFDPSTNSIYLGKEIELQPEPPGTKIEVYFKIADGG